MTAFDTGIRVLQHSNGDKRKKCWALGAGIEEKSTRAGQPQTCNFVLQLFLNYLKNGYVGGRGGRAEGSKLNSRKYVECRFFETRPLTLLS